MQIVRRTVLGSGLLPVGHATSTAILIALCFCTTFIWPVPNISAAERHPNLEGMWTGGTLTPYERPAQLANKTIFTQDELSEQQRLLTEKFWQGGHIAGDVGRDNDAFLDADLKVLRTGQTSLLVAPASGNVPLRPEGERQRTINLSNLDSYETMSQWDRCITRQPAMLFPAVYSNAYQITQTSGSIVIAAEMIHDARVITFNRHKHVDARITSWTGDSIGHWEGAALVVETANFNKHGWIATSGNTGRLRGMPYGSKLHIIEKFTLIDAKTLRYEVTIDDPDYYSAPWTLAFPLTRDDQYRMYEYACHEGNQAIELILRGARVQEKNAANVASGK